MANAMLVVPKKADPVLKFTNYGKVHSNYAVANAPEGKSLCLVAIAGSACWPWVA